MEFEDVTLGDYLQGATCETRILRDLSGYYQRHDLCHEGGTKTPASGRNRMHVHSHIKDTEPQSIRTSDSQESGPISRCHRLVATQPHNDESNSHDESPAEKPRIPAIAKQLGRGGQFSCNPFVLVVRTPRRSENGYGGQEWMDLMNSAPPFVAPPR
ncbi:hypothetical protein GX50_05784 [[Emmonsia] crescens]|uniref:Uncharacterized protein n=1 Tax=[Emmonsia] crescens TaxID=73230 RepID=A0A2B7ZDK1_9EURO|nr:hypothetical protein GX50_05784 [Emmonsia crescens]